MTNSTTQTTFEGQEWIAEPTKSPDVVELEDAHGTAEALLGQTPSRSVVSSLPLLPLTKDTNKRAPSYAFTKDLQPTLREIGFGDVLHLDFGIDPPSTEDEVPLLMATEITPGERSLARHSRKISWTPIRGARVNIPPRLLNARGTAEIGLGLDLSSYGNDNRLLFRVLPAERCIAFQPVKYEEGDQYTYAGEKRPLT